MLGLEWELNNNTSLKILSKPGIFQPLPNINKSIVGGWTRFSFTLRMGTVERAQGWRSTREQTMTLLLSNEWKVLFSFHQPPFFSWFKMKWGDPPQKIQQNQTVQASICVSFISVWQGSGLHKARLRWERSRGEGVRETWVPPLSYGMSLGEIPAHRLS